MKIFLNQLGFLPNSQKIAVITEEAKDFTVVSNGEVVYTGEIKELGYDEASGDNVYELDFSELTEQGKYKLRVNDTYSYSFEISEKVFNSVHNAMLKALYFQRCGCALEEKYAGVFKHDICHNKKSVLLEDENVYIDTTGGWHDAGDYGRYITPAAVTIAHLLYAYKLFPNAFKEKINIPESGNSVDDVLNECKYELNWMLKMQDKNSGGVYHKLTSFTHANFVMPEEDDKQMIVFPVSSMATGAFAAIMALSYDVYKEVDSEFSKELLEAAKLAYVWLDNNQDYVGFANPKGCNTGEYNDSCDLDERYWAAAEMYNATGEKKYFADIDKYISMDFSKVNFGWSSVGGLGSLSILLNEHSYKDHKTQLCVEFSKKADEIKKISNAGKYGVSLSIDGYNWGSNMTVCTNAMQLLVNHIFNNDDSSVDMAIKQLDYIFGKNALGYSYVTGFGEKAFNFPHNRPTVAFQAEKCIAGFVSGGPNSTPADEKAQWLIKPGTPPMKCYFDIWECYSLNEITIYWNSPAIFATAFLYNA